MNLGQVFTKEVVADFMVSLLSCGSDARFLDPCFGRGAFLKAAKKAGYSCLVGYEIDASLYGEVRSLFPDADLRRGDFFGSPAGEEFDAIVLNPPYVRHEAIDEVMGDGSYKAGLKCNPLFSRLPGNANLYMYFVLKSVSLLAEEGELVVIFPGSWLSTPTGDRFSQIIEEFCVVEEECLFQGDAFESDVLVDVVILKYRKTKSRVGRRKTIARMQGGEVIVSVCAATPSAGGLVAPFSSIGRVERGITTGCNALFVNPPLSDEVSRSFLKDIVSSPRRLKGFSTCGAETDELLCISADDKLTPELEEYLEGWKVRIQAEGHPKTLAGKMVGADLRWASLKWKPAKGIWFGYIVRSDMKFVLNERDVLARDNFYVITPSIDPFLALALLNNYYTYYQLERSGKKYGAGLLKVQKYDIDNLAFPDFERFSADKIAELITLGRRLVERNDRALIERITKAVSCGSEIRASQISELLMDARRQRLDAR